MPEPKISDEMATAAIVELRKSGYQLKAIPGKFPATQPVSRALAAVYPLIEAEVRERIAAFMAEMAGNYPDDVFPPTSDSRDAIGGTAMRHAFNLAASTIREGIPVRPVAEESL